MREKIIIILIALIILLQILLINNNSNAIENSLNTNFQLNQPILKKNETFLIKPMLAFTKNCGQIENNDILFYDQGGSFWFTDEGVFFKVWEDYSNINHQSIIDNPKYIPKLNMNISDWQPKIGENHKEMLKQVFVGANKVQPIGKRRLNWDSNFFYGNDSRKWCSNVPNYAEIYYENIYDGIDLRYFTNEKGLKYDFIINPGVDPNLIRIKNCNANGLNIDKSGNMIINSRFGNLQDTELFIYQCHKDIKQEIKGNFQLQSNLEYGFEITSDYDRSKKLIIDPILKFSILFGGTSQDKSQDISVDPEDNVYLTGFTSSSDFNTTQNANDTSYNGDVDIFILKYDQNTQNIKYATYIGGGGSDYPTGIKIDEFGIALISGTTSSMNFPTTTFAYDNTHNGYLDIFILKLNETGSMLLYSTFIGGKSNESCSEIALDTHGNAFITGGTISNNFPNSNGSSNNSINSYDCFILKLDISGSNIEFSFLIGGKNHDAGVNILIDQSNNIIVIGETDSNNFPITKNAYDTTFNGGSDIFVFKLNHNSKKLLFSTYIGGVGFDRNRDSTIDPEGNIYITGITNSTNFPNTTGAYDSSFNGDIFDYDSFVVKLNNNASTILFSTYIGGSDYDDGRSIYYDLAGNLHISGFTYSSNFPTTSDAFNKSLNGLLDSFLVELSKNGTELIYSTFIGGDGYDFNQKVISDSMGNIYLIGDTSSLSLPNNIGPTHHGGLWDWYLIKFKFPQRININSVSLLFNNSKTDVAYARLGTYSFTINLTVPYSTSELRLLKINLDPNRTDLELICNPISNIFTKVNDSNNFITIEQTSLAYSEKILRSLFKWSIIFNVTFNWNFPDENFHNVRIKACANNSTIPSAWLNETKLFKVENDLVFNGTLLVKGEDNRTISQNDLVRGGERINWSGFTILYEGTNNTYPQKNEVGVSVWDVDHSVWYCWPGSGEKFSIQTTTNASTNKGGYNYIINLTGIPKDCDHTDESFTILIDADDVTFSNQWPVENAWQRISEVYTGVTITDHGGGVVDNTSIMHSISEDNGATWTVWNSTEFAGEDKSITVHEFITFNDGDGNFIKWCAKDSLGNGPTESEPYRILVDKQPIFFSDPIPLPTQESSTSEVEVGITISDNTSGVNASTIKYSISTDAGNYWSSWKTAEGYSNGNSLDFRFNLTFPNGTGNRIRWRAYDVAGNGPTYSDEYAINVNIPKPPIIPEIRLISPANNSKITTTSVRLSWEVINNYNPNIAFDIKFGTTNPSTEILIQNHPETALIIDDLENGKTYYWTVIPKLSNINGTCISGIWSFTVDIPLPKAILKTPENSSIITSILPTLVWSLEYEGNETITYDVYFGSSKDPPLEFENLTTTYFGINSPLKDNTTYYWKVVPWDGKYEGFSSEIWSFSVKLKDEKIPKFSIELALNPNPLEIKPGEVKFVSAIVTNLGELKDNFTVQIGDINNSKLTAENYRQDTLEIEPGKNKEFLIMISVEENTKPGFENITITATSRLAEKYNMDVQDSQMLSIKILEKDIQTGKEREQPISIFYFSILLLIIILIIISIIILIIVRKKASKKESKVVETQDSQPETSTESISTLEPETTVEPLPGTTQQHDETLEE